MSLLSKRNERRICSLQFTLHLKWVSLVDMERVRISDKIKWYEVAKIKNIHDCEDCNVFVKKI